MLQNELYKCKIKQNAFFPEQAGENEVPAEVEIDPAQVPLVVAKRQAPELTADCTVYRYGTLATSVEVVRK